MEERRDGERQLVGRGGVKSKENRESSEEVKKRRGKRREKVKGGREKSKEIEVAC